MFSKRNSLDIKKSTTKIQDTKKDLATRIKHLKIILENVDIAESKGLFEANFSHIYNILYESFLLAEQNLRQRVHKAHKEELDCALWILEQVLCLLPELIHKRWQLHSLGRILSKLLHADNAVKYRQHAIRYFLMWYQALGENAPDYVDGMFASIVPGFINSSALTRQACASVFHDSQTEVVSPGELLPTLPAASNIEKDNESHYYLTELLNQMSCTVIKLEWHDKQLYHHKCFSFLLERFKTFYLPKICPDFNMGTNVYQIGESEMPKSRKEETETKFVYCRVSLIMWLGKYTHFVKGGLNGAGQSPLQIEEGDNAPQSLDSNLSLPLHKTPINEKYVTQIVRDVLYSTRENVNFIHEIYRQAFLLNFTPNSVVAIRKIIMVYKDLIQLSGNEIPLYMQEPDDAQVKSETSVENNRRLRADSYLGAIQQKEDLFIRAGMQNVLQMFITHAANVFLLEVNLHVPKILEEQTDACKRVLNIYRHMVMNARMDKHSWEQLLLVLLQITSVVLSESPPKKKTAPLGGRLAPAIFQTLIVTWIKANLNVMISTELWDRFLNVLVYLTSWEDLIKEWAKTLDILTRVLARHVYNLDLTDLPLERAKQKRTARKPVVKAEPNNSQNEGISRQNSSFPDGNVRKRKISNLSRSTSEPDLIEKRKSVRSKNIKHRRSVSLDTIIAGIDSVSIDRTRSPSPAPSATIESSSVKDAPFSVVIDSDSGGGVVCGGSVRGWTPEVAVVLWKRMLGSLGDVNHIKDAKLHAQVMQYLVSLTDTLIQIQLNQGISQDNMSTPPPPDLIPPLTLILPWCFGALTLPDAYTGGRLSGLRLLCTITLQCNTLYRPRYLPLAYTFLHKAMTEGDNMALNISLKYLGPRFHSLQLPGASVLLLDVIHGCNTVLNNSSDLESSPRIEAISIIANLLSLPSDLDTCVLQPEQGIHVMPCPDVKEHIVSILLRSGRREPTARARCIALSALGIFVYKEMACKTFSPKVGDACDVILQALKFNNKTVVQLASNILFLLCEHATTLWSHYPKQAASIIRCLCCALQTHTSSIIPNSSDKCLGTSLLLCLGEWCMHLGPSRLLQNPEYGPVHLRGSCLLLQVFTVLYKIITNQIENQGGLTQPSLDDNFDPNIIIDDIQHLQHSYSPNTQQAITLCAKSVLSHLVTYLGHFPMAIGAARLSSLVVEHDDVPNLTCDELNVNIFHCSNIQLFMLNKNVIGSLVELPTLDLPGGGVTAGLTTASKQVRVILRDLSGKSSWDASIMYKTPSTVYSDADISSNVGNMQHCQPPESLMLNCQNVSPQRAMRHRSPNVLPEHHNSAPDFDQLDDLLQYLGHTSPECLEDTPKLNTPSQCPLSTDIEQEAIASVISERNTELDEHRYTQHMHSMLGVAMTRPQAAHFTEGEYLESEFQQCRLLFSQLCLTGWERRKDLHLLEKNERLLRELRNLDGQRCRETHKVAVIYVGPGQEDKNSILSNQGGSAAYEQFLAGLAWEIELETHTGFLGGLQRQGSTGSTAPYAATSFLEAIFHVATRMPGDTPEAVHNKIRHLGNDEVHIVWSEHSRDYRRDIIPTEFCDILITIYPLQHNLNRVVVNCKGDGGVHPYFGVLFNECIVESDILAGLVRATCLCASRAKRNTLTHYQQHYEERARSLETVVTSHRNATTFEDFLAKVYNPLDSGGGSVHSGGGGDASSLSMLTDALLLDQSNESHKRGEGSSKGVWFNNSNVMGQNIESTSISPRPLKKLSTSLKNNASKNEKKK